MSIPTMDGIRAQKIRSRRITSRVLFSGPEQGEAVLFVHGNVSSATFWEETMLALPPGFWGIAPDQRGYGEADPAKKIDATRGLGDLADDLVALLDYLGIERAHVVGHSLGGSVIWRLMMDYPARIITVTQIAPGSPYGFGGCKGLDGEACFEDYAGSGGGILNPEFVRLLAEGDRSSQHRVSPRAVLNNVIVKPPFAAPREEELLSAMLALHMGAQDYPGDFVVSANWPKVAPGLWGPNNAISPKYAGDVRRLYAIDPKAPVLWLRGDSDQSVSDNALSDPGTLGSMGLLPGWPGADVFPPQPMLGQTRAVLEQYGRYEEVVIEDAGHSPYIEKPELFNRVFHAHLVQGA